MRRLTAIMVEVAGSYMLIPEDQPAKLAARIRGFVTGRLVTNA